MQNINRMQFLGRLLALGAGSGIALSAAQASTARGTSSTLTVAHARGQAQVPAAPQRVVVYDLASLDSLLALQLLQGPAPSASPSPQVLGVPKMNYPAYMARYADTARHPVAGTLFEPDYDALSRLQPELIVVGGRSAAKYDHLSRIAPTLDLSPGADLLAGLQRNVATLASLWGRQAQGEHILQQLQAELQATRAVAAQAAPGLLVLAVNTNLSAQTPGARFGLLHDVIGVRPALAADPTQPRGVPLKMEDIARLNPEWLFVIDRNAATGTRTDRQGQPVVPSRQLFDNALVHDTTAGRKQQVVFVDPQLWYLLGSAGPLALQENARQIREQMQRAMRQS